MQKRLAHVLNEDNLVTFTMFYVKSMTRENEKRRLIASFKQIKKYS